MQMPVIAASTVGRMARITSPSWKLLAACLCVSTVSGLVQAEPLDGYSVNEVSSATMHWDELATLSFDAVRSAEPRAIHPPLRTRRIGTTATAAFLPGNEEAAAVGFRAPGHEMTTTDTTAPVASKRFPAIEDNNRIPPDTTGAVGPTRIFSAVNGSVAIHGRDGVRFGEPVEMDRFWKAVGGSDTFDPKVLYDQYMKRFVFVADMGSTSATESFVLLGVTAGSDPGETWYLYRFAVDRKVIPSMWADYPSVGINKKWIVITQNMYGVTCRQDFHGVKMWAVDKATLASDGKRAHARVFEAGFDGGVSTLVPAHTFGDADDICLVNAWGDGAGEHEYVRVSRLFGSRTHPRWEPVRFRDKSADYDGYVAVQDYSAPICAPQLNDEHTIHAGDNRIQCAVFRNGSLWYAQTGGIVTRSGATQNAALWHQIDPVKGEVIDQGAIVDEQDGVSYFYPSLAVTSDGSLGIGFTGSGPGIHASAFYTNRPAGGARGRQVHRPLLLAKGKGRYWKTFGHGVNRFGDYSATCIDPVDGHVWTLQAHALEEHPGISTEYGRWSTSWGKFDPASSTARLMQRFSVGAE